jgi:hypothetical protein
VALAGIQAPTTTTEYPTCLSNTPSSKLRQLLPPRSRVQIYKINSTVSNKNQPTTTTKKKKNIPTVILQKQSTSTPTTEDSKNMTPRSVNAQLVQLGYAQVRNTQRNNNNPDAVLERLIPPLVTLQQQAMQQQLGVYCSATSSNRNTFFVAEFEDYQDPNGDDTTASTPPPNPGDRVGCSDFETYEDSLRYYERYFPYYGDVARLDRDGDGIPCPKLPHTNNREQYRIKKPTRFVPKE